MSLLRSRVSSRAVVRLGGRFAVLAVAVSLCACSTSSQSTYEMGGYASDTPRRLSGMPPRPYLEIEDDGLEAQLPPLRRNVAIPDDPSEPFSPNYGLLPIQWSVTVTSEPT